MPGKWHNLPTELLHSMGVKGWDEEYARPMRELISNLQLWKRFGLWARAMMRANNLAVEMDLSWQEVPRDVDTDTVVYVLHTILGTHFSRQWRRDVSNQEMCRHFSGCPLCASEALMTLDCAVQSIAQEQYPFYGHIGTKLYQRLAEEVIPQVIEQAIQSGALSPDMLGSLQQHVSRAKEQGEMDKNFQELIKEHPEVDKLFHDWGDTESGE